jgi:hypothetical protein
VGVSLAFRDLSASIASRTQLVEMQEFTFRRLSASIAHYRHQAKYFNGQPDGKAAARGHAEIAEIVLETNSENAERLLEWLREQ